MSDVAYSKTHFSKDGRPWCGARRGLMNPLQLTSEPDAVTCLACRKKIDGFTSESPRKPLVVEPLLQLPYSQQFLS